MIAQHGNQPDLDIEEASREHTTMAETAWMGESNAHRAAAAVDCCLWWDGNAATRAKYYVGPTIIRAG